jgi:hypothetical protein
VSVARAATHEGHRGSELIGCGVIWVKSISSLGHRKRFVCGVSRVTLIYRSLERESAPSSTGNFGHSFLRRQDHE